MLPEPTPFDHTLRPFPIKEALRDRLLNHGPKTLSDAELIAVLIKTGDARMSALDIAYNVLHRYDKDLRKVFSATPLELAEQPGMGRTKTACLIAALELGRRRDVSDTGERVTITNSNAAYNLLKPVLSDLGHEEFHVLLLDRGHRLIAREQVSSGGLHGTVADPKMIFNVALLRRASAMILAHNHPSGQLRPSAEDIHLTKKLVEAGRFLDIMVNDHVIVSQSGYYSFADNGSM